MKFTNAILASAIALALSGCGSDSDNDDNDNLDTESPIISLVGSNTVNLTNGETFTDQGVTITDNVDVGLVATVAGDAVDTSVNATYVITYNVSDAAGNAATEVTRTVNVTAAEVVDTEAPVIALNGDATVTVTNGDVYTDAGVTISDNVDADLVAIVAGDTVDTSVNATYVITYNVADAAGNAATEVTRTVNVVAAVVADTEAPVITLNGSATVNVTNGDVYTDAGVTISDNVDTGLVATVGGDTVDTSVNSTYIITYNVADNAGNAATEIQRTVIVADAASADAPRDASEAVFIVSDGNNNWESWVEANGSSQVIVDPNSAYENVNEVTITANQFVAGYRPVSGVGASIDVSSYENAGTLEFDLKVTSAPAGTDEWFLKVEGEAGTLNDLSIFSDTGDHTAVVVGEWQHYSFNLSELGALDLTAINNIMVFPTWGSNAGAVYQLDNVAFYPDGAVETRTPGLSGDGATTTTVIGVDFESSQLTWESFDTAKVTYVDNPNAAGINPSNTAALFDIFKDDGEWIGARTEGIDNFALDSSNCVVELDVYKDTISAVDVKFEKQNGDGWGSHGSVSVTNTLVNQWETLAFNFCDKIGLPENDDIGAFVVFPDRTSTRAQNTLNYVDNITFNAGEAVTPVEPPVEPPVDAPVSGTELVVNAGFDNDDTDWVGAVVISEDSNKVFKVTVGAAGNAWDVNLSQQITLVADQSYTLSFRAKGTDGRTILAGLGLFHDPWTNTVETVTLTSDWVTYTYTITPTAGDDNSRVIFDMGAEIGDVYLDDISVIVD